MKKTLLVALMAVLMAGGAWAMPPQHGGGNHGFENREMRSGHDGQRGGYQGQYGGGRGDQRGGQRGGGQSFQRGGSQYLQVADAQQVSAMVTYIKGINFDEDRLKAAKLCVSLCGVQTRDLERIAKLFDFDDNRLEFFKAAYRTCPDPGNYITLKHCFSFESNFDKLVDHIAKK